MELVRNLILIVVGVILVLLVLGWLGLQIKPQSFAEYAEKSPELKTMPLPGGLPAPVERFYRTIFGDEIPLIETAVIQGRAVIRPFMNIPFPARFVFVHNAGRDYRHYIEATLFGLPLLKVNEGYVDGKSFFESPMGTYYDDPNTNQGANLALWAEGAWFPSLWLTDARAYWQAMDAQTARLYVPFEQSEESFVVRFNPETGLVDSMEAMRYRDPGEGKPKILWITRSDAGPTLPGSVLGSVGSAIWQDMGRPWATFTLEELVFNVDVSEYIQQRGR